jgi:cell division protein FtsB
MARDEERGMSLRRKIALAAVFFFFVVLLIASLFGKKGLIEIYKARKNYETLLQEIKVLEAKKSRLQQDIQALEKDPEAVEREAREKLWLMKPDEKVIVKKKENSR